MPIFFKHESVENSKPKCSANGDVVAGSSGASTSSAVSLREGQALCVDVPGLASALAELLCTLLPVLQVIMQFDRWQNDWHYGVPVSLATIHHNHSPTRPPDVNRVSSCLPNGCT